MGAIKTRRQMEDELLPVEDFGEDWEEEDRELEERRERAMSLIFTENGASKR